MSNETLWTRVDDLRNETAAIRTEVAVIMQRTDALELRTDRMLTESAESRAETRQSLQEIMLEIRHLRDFQKTEEGRSRGVRRADTIQRWAIPAVISVIAGAKTMGWI